MYPHNKRLKSNSQMLRKTMTPEEKHLWYDFLKRLPIVVKRQFVIDNFILDFFIPSAKISIELDGSQHFEAEARAADHMRDSQLAEYGIKVLRYTNMDVKKSFEGVASDILKNIGLTFEDLQFDR